jgi:hypothetical protein
MRAFRGILKAFAVMWLLSSAALFCQSQSGEQHEQKLFDIEEKVAYEVPIPRSVLGLLAREDEDVRSSIKYHNVKDSYSTTLVSGGDAEGKLYLIMGSSIVDDASVGKFWLVQSHGEEGRPAVIFRSTVDMLELGDLDASGYPVLTTVAQAKAMVTETVFHFVEGKYVAFQRSRLAHYPKEQKVFAIEFCKIHNPVSIPLAILTLLSKEDSIQQARMDAVHPAKPIPKEWFIASRISRSNLDDKLYLLVGQFPLSGAHGTTFWLVDNHGGERKPEVILEVTADWFQVGKPDDSGYPRITTSYIETTMSDEIFHFVAGRYRPLKTRAKRSSSKM